MKKINRKKKIFGLYKKDFPLNVQWKISEVSEYRGLSLEDKLWLGKYNDEALNGRVKKNDPEALHRDDVDSGNTCNKGKPMTHYGECKYNVNAQNRDLFAILNSGSGGGLAREFSASEDGEDFNIFDSIENHFNLNADIVDYFLDLFHHNGEVANENK